jgi:S1-C subfamily serine protease
MGGERIVKRLVLVTALTVFLAGEAWAGARMNFVGPKSRYAKVGLQSNDIVVNIDGIEPKTASDVGTLIFERLGDGKTHEIKVIRAGKEKTLRF